MSLKVTVITICRNTVNEIEDTIKSVLGQSFTDYELLIKDGLSTDGTIDVINRIISENPDKDIRLLSIKDKGIYNAMNQALDEAKGEWVIFINSGDSFYTKDSLKNLCSCINSDSDVVYGNSVVRDNFGDALWHGDLSVVEKKMPFNHQSSMIKTTVARSIRFNEQLKIAADYNMVLGAYKRGCKFTYADFPIAVFCLDGVSSTNFEATTNERYQVRADNGVILKDYINSSEYKKDIRNARFKSSVNKICPKFLMGAIRNFYKKYIKKYEKI